jgi:hypothetical protein
MGEAVGCGLRGLEPVRAGAGPAKLGRDGQWRLRAVLRCEPAAHRKRLCSALHERCARWYCLAILKTWTNVHYAERANIILDRICLPRYWLILDISC